MYTGNKVRSHFNNKTGNVKPAAISNARGVMNVPSFFARRSSPHHVCLLDHQINDAVYSRHVQRRSQISDRYYA